MKMTSKSLPFRSRLSVFSSDPCSSGSTVRLNYRLSTDEDGVSCIVEDGYTNVQDYIDSFLPDVDIYTVLDRVCSTNSSPSDIVKVMDNYMASHDVGPGAYIDISSLPDNVHDVKKGYREMINLFHSLPSDLRHGFHNSIDEFVSGFDSFYGQYLNLKAQRQQVSDKEVNTNG